MVTELRAELRNRLEDAAVAFASDYGPLAAAREGDKMARTIVADILVERLAVNGLRVTVDNSMKVHRPKED